MNNIRASANPRNSRPFKNFSRARKRLREIERIISHRHSVVPETDDADLYLTPVANCFHVIAAGRDRSVSVDGIMNLFWFWCQRWSPHVGIDQAMDIVQQTCRGWPKLIADDILGNTLRLSYADRLRLKATTIGSFDADKGTRNKLAKGRRRERDRVRAAEKRRANGATPRAKSLSRTKPWEAEGISRSTYDRRRKKAAVQAGADDESPSPHPSSIDRRRTLVTEQSPVSKRGAPEAPPPPHRPIIVVWLDDVPDGLILNQDGIEFEPPPPHERRPPPRDWMEAATEGMNGGGRA